MRLKIYIVGLFMFAALAQVNGQLMERENITSTIKTGTRPEAGDFGFTLGTGYAEIVDMIDSDIDFRGLPLLNFNYYFSDRIEITLGTQIFSTSEKLVGDLAGDAIGDESDVSKESYLRFMPGVNYHFASTNVFDTYVGVNGIIGNERDEIIKSERTNTSGDYYSDHYTKSTFVWGGEFNFGARAFIADLPFSIGMEFGIQALKHSNLQYENKNESSVGGVVTEQTFYSTKPDATVSQYSSLDYSKFEMGANISFLLTYYFKK